jgi:hypothetical protein
MIMAVFKITQSLLSAWNYVFDCWEGCEEDAMASFISALRNEPETATEAMLDGRAFEAEVYKEADGVMRPPHNKWESGIVQVAEILRGAQFQVRAAREVEIDGMTFRVVGVLDALRAGTIFDVKYKSKSFGSMELAGSYLNSPQHPFYFFLVPEATEFKYLVSDGSDLYIEQYAKEDCTSAEMLIRQFVQFLESANLLDVYKKYWRIE